MNNSPEMLVTRIDNNIETYRATTVMSTSQSAWYQSRVATRPAFSGNVPISSTNVPRPGKTMVGTPNVPIFRSDESSR
jgi:hypothetical protein